MAEFNFVGKVYDAQITKLQEDAPVAYGKVWEKASTQLVAELIWRYADQDAQRKACAVPGIFWQEGAKVVGTTHDNWNIKNRKNLFALYVRNAICAKVGLQPVQIKEQEVPNQAPKAYKKPEQPQQTVQASVQQVPKATAQNSKVQELLNSRVQLRGNVQVQQQQAAPATKTTVVPSVEIFTDGACSGNPGPGGWGVILRMGNHERELNGGEPSTTNNCMELKAGVEALRALKKPCNVVLTSDSKYLVQGATEWLVGWIKKGWKNSKGDPVANQELWEEIIPLLKTHNVQFKWVKGHNGHPENERCDELARKAIDQLRQQQQQIQMEDDPNLYDFLPDDDESFPEYDPEEEG